MKPIDKIDNFQLLDLEVPEHIEVLEKIAIPRLKDNVFQNIIKYVRGKLHCKSVLVEEQYIDIDYRNEYSNLYSKTFVNYGNTSIRLHFFGKSIRDITSLKTDPEINSETIPYLGYCVLRPLTIGKVGRTILQSHKETEDIFYPLCTADYNVHLFGKEFTAKDACPFISQDTMVMACAQASIWTTAFYLHEKFKLPRVLPFDITENASKSLGWDQRKIPTVGLTVFQMMNALNNLGYSPILFSKPLQKDYYDKSELKKDEDKWNPIDTIYNYLESRIPVLISVPRHAMTIIGHTFDPNPTSLLEQKIQEKQKKYHEDMNKEGYSDEQMILSSSIWTNGFIIQDDQRGPYRILPIQKDNYKSFEKCKELLPDERCSYESVANIEHIIIPLPEKVYLSGFDAHLIAEKILSLGEIERYLGESSKINEFAREIIIGKSPEADDPNPLIIRCYFMNASEFKTAIVQDAAYTHMHDRVRDDYLSMNLPHYIWIAEITCAAYFCKGKERERFILGEILIDSTANKYDITMACLSVHLPGFFMTQNARGTFNKPLFMKNDQPYRHLSRKIE